MDQNIFKPRVVIVGGPDVDARLSLMHTLSGSFDVMAFGSLPELRGKFLANGFKYKAYHLTRQVNPFSDLASVCQLVFLFWRCKPQVVHAFDTKPGVWACLAARLAGVPVVIGTVTGLGSLYGSNRPGVKLAWGIYRGLQKLACRISDQTVFQNYSDALYFMRTGLVPAEKAKIILGSGVPTDVYSAGQVFEQERVRLRRELGIQTGETVVTMVSRVMRSKGVLEYIDAAERVRTANPNVRFLLVGAHDEQSIDRLSNAELDQLSRTITWTGQRRDIPAVLSISDIFVLPSAYREGIPRALLEAASMGLPIITTDSPGCNEAVENGVNGLLIPVHDPAALGAAVLSLVEAPALRHRFGQASRQRAVECFDLSVIAGQTRLMYQDLLTNKRLQIAAA